MYIGIFIRTEEPAYKNWKSIQYVSDLLKENLREKEYGAINHYLLSCIAIKTVPGYEAWSKARRPRYVEHYRAKGWDGVYYEIEGFYQCDFKIDGEDYDRFASASEEEARKIVAAKVVESLSSLDRLSKKAAGFDKERFKSDVINLFKEHDLL